MLKITVDANDAILLDKFLFFREGCFDRNFFIGISIRVFRIVLCFGKESLVAVFEQLFAALALAQSWRAFDCVRLLGRFHCLVLVLAA